MTTDYAQFNTVSITGRVYNAEVVKYNGSEFLSVSLITTLSNDGQKIIVQFTNNNGLKSLYEGGWLPNGRQITVTGHVTEITSIYTNKNGQPVTLKHPQMKLNNAVVADGALGAPPKGLMRKVNVVTPGQVVQTYGPQEAPVDPTPEVEEAFDFA